ncbi:MAG: hypothetical protein ACRD63_02515 [Pyrinomonadaceae bacterium]
MIKKFGLLTTILLVWLAPALAGARQDPTLMQGGQEGGRQEVQMTRPRTVTKPPTSGQISVPTSSSIPTITSPTVAKSFTNFAFFQSKLVEAKSILKSKPLLTAKVLSVRASPTMAIPGSSETTTYPVGQDQRVGPLPSNQLPNSTSVSTASSASSTSSTTPLTTPSINSVTVPASVMVPAVILSPYSVTLAVYDSATSQIDTVSLPKDLFLIRGASYSVTTGLGKQVQMNIVRANGVNTAVTITDDTGRAMVPLVVQYPIERDGAFREIAYYSSAHPALLSTDLVAAGKSYVRSVIDTAAARLSEKGTRISPIILDTAEKLCIVEHVDHTRYSLENRPELFNEIYTLFALNGPDTYRYAVSYAGAGGIAQMIAATYRWVRTQHPQIQLIPDFVIGMQNHVNAVCAMLLYMQDTWSGLASNIDVADALKFGDATQVELMAAGYNSNPARLPLYIRRGEDEWRTLIPRETKIYLQIYNSLDSLVPLNRRSSPSQK